jgi:hypothetical protein
MELADNHFIVSQRDHVWVYSNGGDEAGPFKTREEAVEAAVGEATQLGNPTSEVIVLDRDMQQETVWRYPDN